VRGRAGTERRPPLPGKKVDSEQRSSKKREDRGSRPKKKKKKHEKAQKSQGGCRREGKRAPQKKEKRGVGVAEQHLSGRRELAYSARGERREKGSVFAMFIKKKTM